MGKQEGGEKVVKNPHELGRKIKLTENCVFREMEIDYQNIQGHQGSDCKPEYFWYKIVNCPATEMWFRITFFIKRSVTKTFDHCLEENGYYAILHKDVWKALNSRPPEAQILHK